MMAKTIMPEGPNKKISEASAFHTRKSKLTFSSGILKILLVVLLAAICVWTYQKTQPPPPRKLGSPDGLPLTSKRITLHDGRHLSYKEFGVPKEVAKSKIIYVHCFGCSKYHDPLASASPALVEELGVYIVEIDRPGYGESDPDPKRTVKSLALDIEEFADHMNLGPKFYVAGFSMGGQVIWSCLKYIPHRLAGAILMSPVINYWWHSLPSSLTNEAFSRHLKQDQWSTRVAHYLPWLTYWWNSQSWFPGLSLISGNPAIYTPADVKAMTNLHGAVDPKQAEMMQSQPTLQGKFESLHRDLNIGFGKWEFDPMDIENPLIPNNGSVHLWMGDEDLIVPMTLQRYIAQQLGWINYHEVAGGGHMFSFASGAGDTILQALFNKSVADSVV